MTAKQVRIYVPVTDVTEGWPEMEGVDVHATNAAYCEALAKRIRTVYPDAEVEVEHLPRTFGAVSDRIDAGSWEDEEQIRLTIGGLYDDLMNHSDDWTVLTGKAG